MKDLLELTNTTNEKPMNKNKIFTILALTLWFVKPGGSMSHSQEPNQPTLKPLFYLLKIFSKVVLHLRFSAPRGPPVGLPVKMLKVLLPPPILVTYPAQLNLLYLITLIISG